MKSRNITACAIGALATVLTCSAQADVVDIVGYNPGSPQYPGVFGGFTGTLTYTALTATSGTLDVSLTNTSPSAGGFLNGIAILNSADWAGVTISLASASNANFQNLGPTAASPFGNFRGGAATGGSWEGGGPPANGVANGGSLLATFNVSGAGVGAMSAASFVEPVDGRYQFAVRFRGFDNGESDKVPAVVVPAPGVASMLALGGFAAFRRRRA
jgi:hypothetical protein